MKFTALFFLSIFITATIVLQAGLSVSALEVQLFRWRDARYAALQQGHFNEESIVVNVSVAEFQQWYQRGEKEFVHQDHVYDVLRYQHDEAGQIVQLVLVADFFEDWLLWAIEDEEEPPVVPHLMSLWKWKANIHAHPYQCNKLVHDFSVKCAPPSRARLNEGWSDTFFIPPEV